MRSVLNDTKTTEKNIPENSNPTNVVAIKKKEVNRTIVAFAYCVKTEDSRLVRWVFGSKNMTEQLAMERVVNSLAIVRSGGFKDSMALICDCFNEERAKFLKSKNFSVEHHPNHPGLKEARDGMSAQALSRKYNREEVKKLAALTNKRK